MDLSGERDKENGAISPKNNSNGFKDFLKSSFKKGEKKKTGEELAREKKERAEEEEAI